MSTLLFVLVLLSQSAAEDPYVVKVQPGQDITLPCEAASSSIRAVEWTRLDLVYPEYVLFYSDGHSDKTHQHPSFVGRVGLKDTQMKNGNLSLALKNVSSSDNGIYECRVSVKRNKRAVIKGEPIQTISLQVTDSGSNSGNPKGGDYTRRHAALGAVVGLFVCCCGVFLFVGRKYKEHQKKKSDLSAADKAVGEQLV